MSVRADSGKRFGPGALILGAVLGLAIGLLAAWVVWPVKWADTDPADLRAEHQQTYLLLVADSYAINGDVPLAQRRLQELTPDGRDLSAVASLAEAWWPSGWPGRSGCGGAFEPPDRGHRVADGSACASRRRPRRRRPDGPRQTG